MLLSSFGIGSATIFIWPHECYHGVLFHRLHGCASPASSIFYFASPLCPSRQYYLLFCPSGNIIFYFPHGHAPPVILFSIQPDGHAILAKYFSIWPQGCSSPGKILLITHQGFLRAAFCKLPWRPFLPDSSRLLFIGVGVVFLQHHGTNNLLHPF
jgi:hypothetical protein